MAYVPIPVYTRNLNERYTLVGSKCTRCGFINFPSKRACRKCGNTSSFSPTPLSGRGRIYSYTIIQAGSAPPEFTAQQKATGAYAVAIVELEEGPRIIAQLTDANFEDVKIGAPVESVFRKIYEDEGVVRYGFKFKVIQSAKKKGENP